MTSCGCQGLARAFRSSNFRIGALAVVGVSWIIQLTQLIISIGAILGGSDPIHLTVNVIDGILQVTGMLTTGIMLGGVMKRKPIWILIWIVFDMIVLVVSNSILKIIHIPYYF